MERELLRKFTKSQLAQVQTVVNLIPVLDTEIDVETANMLLMIDGIDPGEAALLSGLLTTPEASFLTGDKKALTAFVENGPADLVARAKGRCHCIESLLALLISRCGFLKIREHLNTGRTADKAISVCLGTQNNVSEAEFLKGIASYLEFKGATLLRPMLNLSD
jgi:hypothetical protein